MEEKELIAQLRKLRQIKPNKDWVVLTKTQILGEDAVYREGAFIDFFPFWKPVLATLTMFGILFGAFIIAQNSLPGDLLYPIKKFSEKTKAVFVSETDKPKTSLELVNKRLEELTKVAQTNQVRNLAPAITEFKTSLSEAAKNLSKVDTSSSDPMIVKRYIDQAKKIGEKTKEVESLGVVTGGEELNELEKVSEEKSLELLVSALKNIISTLEKGSLTEKQAEILSQMKKLVEEEKYQEALELYLTNQ